MFVDQNSGILNRDEEDREAGFNLKKPRGKGIPRRPTTKPVNPKSTNTLARERTLDDVVDNKISELGKDLSTHERLLLKRAIYKRLVTKEIDRIISEELERL